MEQQTLPKFLLLEEMCRLCGKDGTYDVYGEEGSKLDLHTKINECLPKISVNKDGFSWKICQDCVDFVNSWQKFCRKALKVANYVENYKLPDGGHSNNFTYHVKMEPGVTNAGKESSLMTRKIQMEKTMRAKFLKNDESSEDSDSSNNTTNDFEMESGNDKANRKLEFHRKLFIGGLDPRTTDEVLKQFYKRWGKIVDFVVMKDAISRRSRGFGFVTYATSAMVDEAMAGRPHKIDGKTVEPKRAIPRNGIQSENNATVSKIFVGGIDYEVSEGDMWKYFSRYGNVINVLVITDKNTGRRRGFGFVEFDDYDPVDKVILTAPHMLNGKKVEVKKAVGKYVMASKDARGGMGGGNGGSGHSRGEDQDGGHWGDNGDGSACPRYFGGPPGGYNKGSGDNHQRSGDWGNSAGGSGVWGRDYYSGGYDGDYVHTPGPMRSSRPAGPRSEPYSTTSKLQ